MQIIKLDATDSTNSFLKRRIRQTKVEDNTLVIAGYQTEGRGQMGKHWRSEPAKNLTFSLFKKITYLDNDKQFYISMAVALAVYNALKKLQIPDIYIKWPNDILSANKKICGILIENIIKKGRINAVIIGVGLNVNQQDFENLPKATSLKNITGISYAPDAVLQYILTAFQVYIGLLKEKKFGILKAQYEDQLFRKDKPSTFKDTNNKLFTGIIKGITDEGKLIVYLEDETTKAFALKELQLLY